MIMTTPIGRPPSEGLIYVRRSSTKQDSGIYTQLDWALNAARNYGVRLEGTRDDLDHMVDRGLVRHKSIFLDSGVTGADLARPGFTACRQYALANKAVSHLVIHMSDRFARPESAVEAMPMEQGLLKAGITVVFSNRVSEPRRRWDNRTSDDVMMLLAYTESGEYLNKLAVRMIESQVNLAEQGYWTGGRPPYGFARFRVFPDGRSEQLADRVTVRSPGSHTEIRPVDDEKIRVWVMMLHWCHEKGWGCKRIGSELNAL